MKKLAAVLIAIGALSGCVAYPVEPGYGYRGDRGYHGYRDRDRDGVPNRYDRRPNNPYRY